MNRDVIAGYGLATAASVLSYASFDAWKSVNAANAERSKAQLANAGNTDPYASSLSLVYNSQAQYEAALADFERYSLGALVCTIGAAWFLTR